jgi:hypothetical protein
VSYLWSAPRCWSGLISRRGFNSQLNDW